MKSFHVLLVLFCFMFTKSYQAQNYPLDTYMENIPTGVHFKDINHDLDRFVGTYQANYKGNTITFTLSKLEDIPLWRSTNYFSDGLTMAYTIKNSSGHTIQTNGTNYLNEVEFSNFSEILNRVTFIYSGTYCGNGNGFIYLKYKNPQQLGWVLKNGTDSSSNCPPGSDETVYLPEWDEVIFTRQ